MTRIDTGITRSGDTCDKWLVVDDVEVPIYEFKPLLRDLSHFKQDHIALVKEFIGTGRWCDEYDNYFDIWFYYSGAVQDTVLQCPYEIVQFFFKNHFDVFGLIGAGFASELKQF
jgi:hypothetical protein